MRTTRDEHLWKVRVLINKSSQDPGDWASKTFFYSREVFANRWVTRAEKHENIRIDFYGMYNLEEEKNG